MSKSARSSEIVVAAGARLRATRSALDVEQSKMAESVGASPQNWNDWERGRHLPDVLAVTRASQLYGFTLDWIYGGELSGLRYDLAQEMMRRRPDLVRGAPPDAAASPDWDSHASAKGRWRRRSA